MSQTSTVVARPPRTLADARNDRYEEPVNTECVTGTCDPDYGQWTIYVMQAMSSGNDHCHNTQPKSHYATRRIGHAMGRVTKGGMLKD